MQPLPKAGWLVEWSYRISLTAKGLLGLTQLIAGFGLWLSPGGSVQRLVDWMTRNELAQDPTDPLAARIIAWASSLGPAAENFYAIYLLGHGALNSGVVIALLLRLRGAYHVSLFVLGVFVIYQLRRFSLTFDPVLLLLTGLDVIIILLVVLERRQTHR